MHADMAEAVEGRARRDRGVRHAGELAAELLLDEADEFLDAEGVEHVFEPRLGAVGAVAVVDEHPHDGVGDRRRLGRLADDAGLAGEILWPVMPPTARRNQTPGSTPKPSFTSTAEKPMSLVSSSTGITPAPSNPTLNLRGRP